MSRKAVLCLLILATVSVRIAGAAGRVVEGSDEAYILPPTGAVVAPYSNDGYSVVRRGPGFLVQVSVTPLASTARFELPTKPSAGTIGTLAWRLVAGIHREGQAVERVLGWVSRNIQYDLDRRQSQSAVSVLARRRGYCTGIAALSVALLRSVGIEAREVDGYVSKASPGGGSGYHRWIEVFYPDRGWVFSDPTSSHGFVRATYLRLSDRRVTPTWLGEPGRVVWRRDHLRIVDRAAAVASSVWVRPLSRDRSAGAIDLSLGRREGGEAWLYGIGFRWREQVVAGKASFVGLEAGRYRLDLHLADGSRLQRTIDLGPKERMVISLPAVAVLERQGRRER